MKRIVSIVSILVALAASSVAAGAQDKPSAQDKPNFAGTWKLSDPAQPDMFTPSQLVVAQDATELTVTATGQMGEFTTKYKLDGSMGRSPIDFNGQTIDRATKVAWNGSKLTLTTTSEMNGQTIEFKSVLSLSADGALMVESTFPDFQGGGGPITQKATYKKS
jgi:hypothetical protein